MESGGEVNEEGLDGLWAGLRAGKGGRRGRQRRELRHEAGTGDDELGSVKQGRWGPHTRMGQGSGGVKEGVEGLSIKGWVGLGDGVLTIIMAGPRL